MGLWVSGVAAGGVMVRLGGGCCSCCLTCNPQTSCWDLARGEFLRYYQLSFQLLAPWAEVCGVGAR